MTEDDDGEDLDLRAHVRGDNTLSRVNKTTSASAVRESSVSDKSVVSYSSSSSSSSVSATSSSSSSSNKQLQPVVSPVQAKGECHTLFRKEEIVTHHRNKNTN